LKKLLWFCGFVSLHACSAEHYVLTTENNHLCFPLKYVVKIDESVMPPGNYDPSGGGYDISLIFDADELATSVADYQKIPLSLGIPGYQKMYVMLAKPLALKKIDPVPSVGVNLEAAPQLMRLEKDEIAWQVGEKRDQGYFHWGQCSNTFDADNSFDCIRDLITEDLTMSYVIHEPNLKAYPAIDEFLIAKMAEWRCAPDSETDKPDR
jgi:hypothetical protein